MATIAEATLLGKNKYVIENFGESAFTFGQLQFAHTRRVYQQATGMQAMNPTGGCCMAAFRVVLTDVLNR